MQAAELTFETLNQNKANFDAIYTCLDPREYFRILYGLDYVIPDLAKDVFRALIRHRIKVVGHSAKVIDLGCSYGINAALVRYPLDMARLAQRYADPSLYRLPSDRLADLDRNYFKSWPEEVEADFVGVDTSEAAIAYARKVGLIDAGVAGNLESAAPAHADALALRDADLIVSTGCVGYVTEKTFVRILDMQSGQMPWVASFVLRMFPYEAIATRLEQYGLVTERLEGVTFVQRRFHSRDEYDTTLASLKSLGLDPSGKEADGLLHAELFVSRPKADVLRVPLGEIVSVTSGEGRSYGRRFRRIASRDVKLMN